MDELMIGIGIGSAASMLVTFGMGLQLFRSKVRVLNDTLLSLASREEQATQAMRGITDAVVSLERSVRHRFELQEKVLGEARREHETSHAHIIEKLK